MAVTLEAAKSAAREELIAAGFASDAETVMTLVRPAVFFLPGEPGFEDDIAIGASKIGGSPDLPEGVEWPGSAAFLVQINLADVPEGVLDIDLPREGLLSCFRDDDDWRNQAVLIWTKPGVALTRREIPEACEAYEPRALTGDIVLTLDFDRSDIPEFDDEEVLDVVCDWVVPEAGIQLGGDRAVIQSGGNEDELLVLQIGSVDEVGMMWGDLGCLYISLTPADLTARKFEKAVTEMQCY